jgi:aryl-alcohol dehydrogenase-like predicted oxidoreductase
MNFRTMLNENSSRMNYRGLQATAGGPHEKPTPNPLFALISPQTQKTMKNSPLGSRGLHTSQLGLGCMGMSDFYGSREDADSLKTLHHAIERGVTFYDTADMYGPFHNEELLGRGIAGRREGLTIATKFGIVRDPVNAQVRGLNGKPEYVQQACEASLRRLNIDVIDLYYLHRVDPATPVEDTVGAMAKLVEQGKVRGIGLSEVSAATLRRMHAIHPISAVQSEYSLWSRDPEEDGVLEACRELGIAFVAYSPLGRGFLTGQIKTFEDLEESDWRRHNPRFQGKNFIKNLDLVRRIQEMATRKSVTPAQLALAWVMAQGEYIFPIPGTKRIPYLDENLGAMDITFTAAELAEIDEIAPVGAAAGTRYPEAMMGSVGR